MISKIENVQLVCKALVDYEIDQFVISPGGSSMAIVHTIENTLPDALTYPIVDERSASYFALGLWQKTNRPVCLICTSGTAVANYLPGIIEAHYQRAQIIILTADKDTNYNHQRKTQIIDQTEIFKNYTNFSTSLHGYCTETNYMENKRRVTNAFKEIKKPRTRGPVHINTPIIGPLLDFTVKTWGELNYPKFYFTTEDLSELRSEVNVKSKILLVIGQSVHISSELKEELDKFKEKFNVFIYTESTSNYWPNYGQNFYSKVEIDPKWCAKNLNPDILISFGGNLVTYQMHTFIESITEPMQHWSIQYHSTISDNFGKASKIIDCPPVDFFKNLNTIASTSTDFSYRELWFSNAICINQKNEALTNLSVIKEFCEKVPENAVVHTSILNSTRWVQFFQDKALKGYSNIGALGIDGSLSTYLGYSASSKDHTFYITGELSFLYDMNSLSIAKSFSRLRILLINNGGGGEFHLTAGKKNIPSLDKNISIKEIRKFGSWPSDNNFLHKIISKKEEIDEHLLWFFEKDDSNKLLEVSTNMEEEGNIMRNIFQESKSQDGLEKTKNVVKKILGKI